MHTVYNLFPTVSHSILNLATAPSNQFQSPKYTLNPSSYSFHDPQNQSPIDT